MASNKITIKLRDLDEEEVKKIDALMDLARVFKKHKLYIHNNEAITGNYLNGPIGAYGFVDVKDEIFEIHRDRIYCEQDLDEVFES